MEKLMKTVKNFFTGVVKYFTKGRNTVVNPNDKNTLDDCKNVKINTKKLNRFFKTIIAGYIVLIVSIIVLVVALVNVNLRINGQSDYIRELQNDMTELLDVNEHLTKERSTYTDQINSLTTENEEKKKENEELKNEIKELNEKVSSLETTKKAAEVAPTSAKQPSVTVSRDGTNINRQVAATQASADDRTLLAKIIYAEAGGSSEEDMMLVGNVVMNRVAHAKFPNTIHSVIYAKGQYSPTWNGAINKTPSELAYKCADRLLAGERIAPANVVFQAQFKQGSGVWKVVGNHYYCYA